MEKVGTVEIHIVGVKGNNQLTPDNFDVKEIRSLLESVEDILFPNNKTNRPDITYSLSEGSVRNVFKTSMQAVIAFSAVMAAVSFSGSIDGLELPTARAIETIQTIAVKKNYTFDFKTSLDDGNVLTVSPRTYFYRNIDLWVDAEFYFYGTLTNAGGKDKSNIHLDTKDAGVIIIDVDKNYLKNEDKNLLYKEFGVRVLGKQNVETGEIDKQNLKLVELIDYSPRYDETYINSLISKVGDRFKDIDVDNWISEIRGRNDD